VAAVSAGVLAGGSYLLVREARLRESQNRAVDATSLDVNVLRQSSLPRRPSPEAVRRLLATFTTATSETVATVGGRPVGSVSLSPAQVPPELVDAVALGFLSYQRTSVGGTPYLVVGAPVPGLDVRVYTFFSEARIHGDLRLLGIVLLAGWGGVLLVAGLVGSLLARRTLGPVARASDAARSLAEGLLQTRLPVQSRDEFGAWAASFNQMAEALEAKIADLQEAGERERRFTSDVAHELRTPLTALVGEASLLQEHLDQMPRDARRPAELLVGDVGRLRRLVEDLMEISRLDAGRESVRVEPVDVRALVEATVRARGWQGRVEVSGDGIVLDTDRRRLERVVGNLVGNAVEHAGRDVVVTVGADGGGAFVEVFDHGPGIRPHDLPHLFERFYKADPSRTGPGSGLGLSIALENVRLLGGDIRVESEVGAGTRFTVSLPERPPVTEPLPPGDAGANAGGQHRPAHPEGGAS
jgi:signal transduction histidine kinase